MVQKLLTRCGFVCLLASDAESALAILRNEDVDAVISDIHMPGNDSLEFIESIPKIRPGLPVFLLTGEPSFDTAVRSVRLSVAAYLTKPLVLKDLLPALAENIVRYRRARAVSHSRERAQKWAADLAVLETELSKPSAGNRAGADYLALTMQNIAIQLSELAKSMVSVGDLDSTSQQMEKAELVNAMRQTIVVLESTRKNFKSKELGELRRQLSTILKDHTGENL